MKTCASCKHFHAAPIPRGPAVIGEERQGECRESYHMLAMPVQTPQGMGMNIQPMFLKLIAASPACGRHAEILEMGLVR